MISENINDMSKLLKKGYILLDNKGKIEIVKRPNFGEVTIIFQDGLPVLNHVNTKNKF